MLSTLAIIEWKLRSRRREPSKWYFQRCTLCTISLLGKYQSKTITIFWSCANVFCHGFSCFAVFRENTGCECVPFILMYQSSFSAGRTASFDTNRRNVAVFCDHKCSTNKYVKISALPACFDFVATFATNPALYVWILKTFRNCKQGSPSFLYGNNSWKITITITNPLDWSISNDECTLSLVQPLPKQRIELTELSLQKRHQTKKVPCSQLRQEVLGIQPNPMKWFQPQPRHD